MKRIVTFVLLVVSLVWAVPVDAAPGVHNRNRVCIKFYSEWQKKPKHRAFAVATSSEAQACSGTWGYGSVEAAIAAAKKWCKTVAIENAQCAVTKAE